LASPPPDDIVFRGVNRHGLDQLHVGLAAAPMNQRRDESKPTWKIGAELRLAIGGVMKFDPMAPQANHDVGYGVDELRLWTSFDRRLGWAEPWVELWWQVPYNNHSDSLFRDPFNGQFGETDTQKGQQAGASFGFEAYPIEDKQDRVRVGLDLSARFVGHFEGRDYSEMWEVFAFAGDARNPNNPLILDGNPLAPGSMPFSHPGITNIENYLEYAGRAAIRAELGTHVRFAAFAEYMRKTDHLITFANAGVDRNGNNLVDPGTNEVNPLHCSGEPPCRGGVDLVGHRYLSANNNALVVGVQGMVLF
jgi:hypothetical protein